MDVGIEEMCADVRFRLRRSMESKSGETSGEGRAEGLDRLIPAIAWEEVASQTPAFGRRWIVLCAMERLAHDGFSDFMQSRSPSASAASARLKITQSLLFGVE